MTIELWLDRRTEVIGRTASTEGDAVVGRALSVDDEAAIVVEGLAGGPPDGVEERIRQRLGRDHQRVDRRDRAAVTRQAGGEPLRGAHHDVGRYGTGLASHPAVVQLQNPCA